MIHLREKPNNWSYKSLWLIVLLVISSINMSCSKKRLQQSKSKIVYKEYLDEFNSPKVAFSFKGVVLSQNAKPIANAKVNIGDSIITTNNSGEFELNDHLIDKDFIYIVAEHEGYKSQSIELKNQPDYKSMTIVLIPYDSLSLHWFSKYNHAIK